MSFAIRLAPALLCGLLLSCGSRSERTPPSEIREFDFGTPPASAPGASLLQGITPSIHGALEALESAAEDEECKGVFVRVGGFGGAWGRLTDLGHGLDAIREAGKAVHCHFDATDNAGYALMAGHCDRISMTPAGVVDLVGLAFQVVYLKGLLEHIGVEANILHVGRFKGAGDMFTEETMPATAQESLGSLLDDIDAVFAEALRARDLEHSVVDNGPYTSVPALELNLVDDIVVARSARATLRSSLSNAEVRRVFPPQNDQEFSLSGLLLGGEDSSETQIGRRIVVVHVDGSIVDGARSRSGQAVSGPFVEALNEFADDDNVAAIVLRIDSPGGSVIASDVMWNAVREAQAEKPVIASVGDVAASGGYYIASAADVIFAHPGSIVGSIGVVGGKMSFAGLAEEIGVHPETLRRGPNANWSSPLTPFSDSQEVAFQRLLRSAYYRFIRRVAVGRGRPENEILDAAEGRVMSGRQGIERGLIDEAGGLAAAIAEARVRAEDEEGALPIVVWPEAPSPIAALGEALGARAAEAQVPALGPLRPLAEEWMWFPALLEQESVLAALPFALRIQ